MLASALARPGYHVESLADALGGEVPEDPWGHPYVLLHGSAALLNQVPGLTVAGTDALFLGVGQGCATPVRNNHLIASGGPDGLFGNPEDLAGLRLGPGDLFVEVPLGPPPRATPLPSAGPGPIRLTRRQVTLHLWDHSALDGDRVEVSVGSKVVAADVLLGAFPGAPVSVTLPEGTQTLTVRILNMGDQAPNTGALDLSDRDAPGAPVQWSATPGEAVHVTLEVPSNH